MQRLLGNGRRLNVPELLQVNTQEVAAARQARRNSSVAALIGDDFLMDGLLTPEQEGFLDDYEPAVPLRPTLVPTDAGPGQALLAALNLADPEAQAAVSYLQYLQLYNRWVVKAVSAQALEDVVLPRLLAVSGAQAPMLPKSC